MGENPSDHDLLLDLRRLVQDHVESEDEWRGRFDDWRNKHEEFCNEQQKLISKLEARPTAWITHEMAIVLERTAKAMIAAENRCLKWTLLAAAFIFTFLTVTHLDSILPIILKKLRMK